MKRLLFICLALLCVATGNAVLKEKDLARTLGVLRAELASDYEKQQIFMQMYEQQGAAQHQQLVAYMNQCEQIGLMLYSQSTDNTFDMAYACQQAVDLHRKLDDRNGKMLPYDRIIARMRTEIERYDALIASLKSMPPVLATDSLSESDSILLNAIDSLREKAALIRHALSIPTVTLFASMGAALKMDPFQIRATEFRKVEGDGLARALRTKFKKTGGMPARKFKCVWSPERRENLGPAGAGGGLGECVCPKDPGVGESSLATHEWCSSKARINGTIAHTTAIFGFALAGLVIQDVEQKIV
jgi:hypothetical protein